MRRARSPDSENDDSYDEQDFQKDGCPSQSYHISDRKKRRGVIEKRRRDRINNSLCELRRLVPAAFEKQGSAKLEKAEILQMTVDHLKLLHSKGLGSYNVDTTALALDYRIAGFRECAAEVARYLVSVEGLDLQDPLRLRLMSHLQCYCAQREAAAVAKATMPNATWNHVTAAAATALPRSNISNHYGHPGAAGAVGPQAMAQHVPSQMDQSNYIDHSRIPHHVEVPTGVSHGGHGSMRLPVASVGVQMPGTSSTSGSQMAHSMLAGLPPPVHTQFLGVNSMPMLSPNGLHYHSSSSSSSSSTSNILGQGMKPYRPWGAELVY